MKHGRTLSELAVEIERQTAEARDLVIPANAIQMTPEATLALPHVGDLPVTHDAHDQLAAYLDIPTAYYHRMRKDRPELLAANVNTWAAAEPQDTRRMVRTLDGKARAVLSDRYRRIDNYQVLSAALPVMRDSDLTLLSCDVTDRNLFIQAVFPRIEGEVKVGDIVQAGFIVRNSETGFGALDVSPMVYRLVCKNGMIGAKEYSNGRLRKTHIGPKVGATEDFTIYASDTLEADDRALMLKIRDAIAALSRPELFMEMLGHLRRATEGERIERPVPAIEELGKSFNLTKREREGALEALIREGDYSRYGALNAVTNIANSAATYDRAVELEQVGGRILTLTRKDWERIATAEAA